MVWRNIVGVASSLSVIGAVTLVSWLGKSQLTGVAISADDPQSGIQTTISRKASPEFTQAGVCARCHVVSVLEWGISGHVAVDTNCQQCHGPSQGHVANERNEVKPDRLFRGEAIAKQICSSCHEMGCPESLQVQNCQTCHHVHALINPKQPPREKDNRLEELVKRWQRCEQRFEMGEQHIKQREWEAARKDFREVLALIPGYRQANQRLTMCERRLNPHLTGFDAHGNGVDFATGLPNEVSIAALGTRMILVRPGEFDMGSDVSSQTQPIHTVPIDAFYLGKYEVTQKLWMTIMNENPSRHQGNDFPDTERWPVERVSWDDCQQFLGRLNERVAGGGFRLPTEAEWEYACRAGKQDPENTLGSHGDETALNAFAWYRYNSLRNDKSKAEFIDINQFASRKVGTRQPNPWGFYDMQGNVAEWCSSLFRPYLYNAVDGRESLLVKEMRVIRGGGFADSVASLHPALRHAERSQRRLRWNGLRLARSIPSLQ